MADLLAMWRAARIVSWFIVVRLLVSARIPSHHSNSTKMQICLLGSWMLCTKASVEKCRKAHSCEESLVINVQHMSELLEVGITSEGSTRECWSKYPRTVSSIAIRSFDDITEILGSSKNQCTYWPYKRIIRVNTQADFPQLWFSFGLQSLQSCDECLLLNSLCTEN